MTFLVSKGSSCLYDTQDNTWLLVQPEVKLPIYACSCIVVSLSYVNIGGWIDQKRPKIILCFCDKRNLWISFPHIFKFTQSKKLAVTLSALRGIFVRGKKLRSIFRIKIKTEIILWRLAFHSATLLNYVSTQGERSIDRFHYIFYAVAAKPIITTLQPWFTCRLGT